ncbi:hypothetical protein [Nostoc sp.]|uniref:hypothetical protein n=1 Tax=Nostoc sp. TaxID=1180 RepID=UPI002FF596B1
MPNQRRYSKLNLLNWWLTIWLNRDEAFQSESVSVTNNIDISTLVTLLSVRGARSARMDA